MSHILQTYARFPLTITRGEGARIWDDRGRPYLDFCMGIATCSIGHSHPALTKAINEQANTLLHCSNLYHIPNQEKLATLLVERIVRQPGKIFFSNSGAEANDGMIKTARRFGHARPNKNGEARYEVITFSSSFHGRTLGSMAATGQKKIQQGFDPMLPGFRYATLNEIDALKSTISDKTAGVMLEPIQGEGGVNAATPEFLQAVQELCKEHDLLLMLDEVQCGCGRTGKINGWESIIPDLKPDTISWAKGMGGGFPIGSFYVSDRSIDAEGTPLSSIMNAGSHGSTYGGNPLACAASLAVLETILQDKLTENAATIGSYISETIHSWNLPSVREVKGKGLLLGVALNAEQLTKEENSTPALTLCNTLINKGLLAVPAGAETLRLLPPLNVTKAETEAALAILKEGLESITI